MKRLIVCVLLLLIAMPARADDDHHKPPCVHEDAAGNTITGDVKDDDDDHEDCHTSPKWVNVCYVGDKAKDMFMIFDRNPWIERRAKKGHLPHRLGLYVMQPGDGSACPRSKVLFPVVVAPGPRGGYAHT